MKFVHASDIHLGRFYKGELPLEIAKKRREELWNSFENLINFCIKESIEILLLTGDLYEKEYFTLSDIDRFSDILNKLKTTEVFIIAGNHDYLDEKSLYNKTKFNNNIHLFKKEKYFDLEQLGVRIHGFSWDKDKNYSRELKFDINKNYRNIILLHGSVGTDDYFPLNVKSLENLDADYIGLGHIHLRQKVLDNVYYPGSLEGLNFKEVGNKGFILGSFKEELYIEYINTNIRKYNKIEININKDMNINDIQNDLFKKLENKENDLNRIYLKGEFENPDYLMEVLDNISGYFYIEFKNELEKSISIEEIYIENKDNLIGKFIDRTKDDKYVLEIGLKALLEAKNGN